MGRYSEVDLKERLSSIIARGLLSDEGEFDGKAIEEFVRDVVYDVVKEGVEKGNYAYVVYKLKELEEAITNIILSPDVCKSAQDILEFALSSPEAYIIAPCFAISNAVAVGHITGLLSVINALRSAFRDLKLKQENSKNRKL